MKIKTLSEISTICKKLKKQGKTVGLITGCFDVLHYDHLSLFQYAKKKVDALVIGLENDKSIGLSKERKRPLFSQNIRSEMIAGLESVDYVFIVSSVYNFSTKKADEIHDVILKKLKPTHLITNKEADNYWRNKKMRANKLEIVFVGRRRKRNTTSSAIIRRLVSEL